VTNPLVAQTKDSTTAVSGVPLLEDAQSLKSAIEGGDWASAVLGVAGTAMDVLAVVADPFGSIFAAGVGWLMEHVGPLKDALDKLAGNPDVITAHSETWQNISDELGSISQDLTNDVNNDLGGWQGAGADTYRQQAGNVVALLGAAQQATAGTSKGVKTAGEVVAAVRQLVRDTIAQVVGHMISWALQVVATLGIGLAWVVPQVIDLVGKTATRIATLVKNLTTALKQLMELLKKAGGIFDDAAKALKNIKSGTVSTGSKVDDLPAGARNVDPVGGNTTPSGTHDLPHDKPDTVAPPPKLTDNGTTTPSAATDTPPPVSSRGLDDTGAPPPKSGNTTPSGNSRSLGSGDDPHTESTRVNERCAGGDPVDLVTGEMFLTQQDVGLLGVLPLVLERFHGSTYRKGHWFGHSWASTLDQRVEIDAAGIHYAAPDGVVLHYPVPSRSGGAVLPVAGARWPLFWDRERDTILIEQPEPGLTLHFPPGPSPSAGRPLRLVSDRNGNLLTFLHDEEGMPTDVYHSAGYHLVVEKVDTDAGARIGGIRLAGAGRWPDVGIVSFRYDPLGRLVGVLNSQNRALVFEYDDDDDDRIVGWTDRNGHSYRYHFDGTGRVTRTDGTGGFLATTFSYDLGARTTNLTDSLGNATTYEWNDHNQVIKTVDPLGGVTATELDQDGRLSTRTDPLGRTLRVTHGGPADPDSARMRVDSPEGTSFDLECDDRLGLPTKLTDRNGAVWLRTYDARGNIVSEQDPSGVVIAYEYGEHGDLVAVTDSRGGVTRFRNNTAGLPIAVTDPTGATTLIERDVFGRIIAVTDASGAIVRTGFTVEGLQAWQVEPDGTRQEWTYDPEGNLIEHRGPGGLSSYEYGPFDQIVASTDPTGARFSFTYDTELRLTEVRNPQGLRWHYEYDAAGNLTAETDFNGSTVRYRHDAAGQLLERVNGAGQHTVYVRDALGRVVERRSGDAVYRFAFDAAGRTLSASGPDSSLSYTYDSAGRVLTESVDGHTTAYTYDVSGRRATRTTPSGAVSRWTYDVAGRPATLAAAGGGLIFHRDVRGRETGLAAGPAVLVSQAFDSAGRMSGQTIWARHQPQPGQPPAGQAAPRAVQERTYVYRADGYPVRITDRLSGPRQYDLDSVGRVTAVRAAGWTETYAYDAAGNLAHAAAPGQKDAHGEREHTGTLVRRAGRTNYERDAHGRVVRTTRRTLSGRTLRWTWAWDAEDRLIRATTPEGATWQYSYDAIGRRTAKRRLAPDGSVAEVIWFSWDGSRLAEQSKTTPGGREVLTWDWEPGGHRVLAQTTRTWRAGTAHQHLDTAFHAIVTDPVGTPTELVAPDGRIAWHANTSLWGETVAPAGVGNDAPTGPRTGFPLRFPGQYHDGETGLNYNFQRYYDPSLGTYLTPDPLGLNPAPNNHAYVDNPLATLDPLGLAPSCATGLSNNLSRTKRKWGRKVNDKTTPQFVYRVDNRPPGEIGQHGFQPHDPNGTISVDEHVNNVLNRPGPPQVARPESQYVSTGDYAMFQDGVIGSISTRPGATVYKIDTSAIHNGFTDVNAHFDNLGVNRPYPFQREYAYAGRIPPSAIVGHAPAMDVYTHPDFRPDSQNTHNTQLPDPDSLNWQQMP